MEMIKDRIAALRDLMRTNGWDAVIFLSGDPHQNEYLPEYYKVRQWISGFTGSAGTVVITQHHAGLWTDGRYFLQADQQLAGTGIELHKLVVQGAPEYAEWIAADLPSGSTVICDGNTISVGLADLLRSIFATKGIQLVTAFDPVIDIWKDRPSMAAAEIFEHPLAYAGKSRKEKMDEIRQKMQAIGAKYYLVSALDDIGWLLNLRGKDIQCNPVFLSYVLLDDNAATLFTNPQRVPDIIKEDLLQSGVSVLPYESVKEALKNLSDGLSILVNPGSLSDTLAVSISHLNRLDATSPIMLAKSIKNDTEQHLIRNVMVRDGVALTNFFYWLEKSLEEGSVLTEYDLAQKLIDFRQAEQNYIGESFDAIIGYKANGAIIHYKPEQDTAAVISLDGLLLVDSGGQYLDGTTDTTRTVALSAPTDHEREMNTLVLKGHIALASVIFPEGTKGVQLDILARKPLWDKGLNYMHGTGHGVGFFMNVHEPPQGFVNSLAERGITVHHPGQLTSNEPGFYEVGSFGIRIENLVLCKKAVTTNYGQFLEFETVTLCYLDKQLIDKSLLSPLEINWLDQYHQRVYDSISPFLNPEIKLWLADKCSPLA